MSKPERDCEWALQRAECYRADARHEQARRDCEWALQRAECYRAVEPKSFNVYKPFRVCYK